MQEDAQQAEGQTSLISIMAVVMIPLLINIGLCGLCCNRCLMAPRDPRHFASPAHQPRLQRLRLGQSWQVPGWNSETENGAEDLLPVQ